MADGTSIEWTRGDDGTPGGTWNPVLGCDRVSEGCDACYAIPQARLRASNPHPAVSAAFAGLTHRTPDRLDWTGRVNQLPDRLTQPLTWRKPRRIFVNSLSDMFHGKIEVDFIARVFAVMSLADQHVFQMLTKRPARMRYLLNNPDFGALVDDHRELMRPGCGDFAWPIPGLWLGVSVENQRWAGIRIPALLATPAAVRWISAEPLLGPIDLREVARVDAPDGGWCAVDALGDEPGRRLNWVVAGGESGPGARPMHPDWARSLRDQCAANGTAFFHKQNGAYAPVADRPAWGDVWVRGDGSSAPWDSDDGHIRHGLGDFRLGDAALVRKLGKKAAGRELDGRTWDEFPHPAEVAG